MLKGHGRIECSCGNLIATCKCLENHNNVEIWERGCNDCHKSSIEIKRNVLDGYIIIKDGQQIGGLKQQDLEVLEGKINEILHGED